MTQFPPEIAALLDEYRNAAQDFAVSGYADADYADVQAKARAALERAITALVRDGERWAEVTARPQQRPVATVARHPLGVGGKAASGSRSATISRASLRLGSYLSSETMTEREHFAKLGEIIDAIYEDKPVSPEAARDEQVKRIKAVFSVGPNEMFPLHPEAAPPRFACPINDCVSGPRPGDKCGMCGYVAEAAPPRATTPEPMTDDGKDDAAWLRQFVEDHDGDYGSYLTAQDDARLLNIAARIDRLRASLAAPSEEIGGLRKLAEQATPGPWEFSAHAPSPTTGDWQTFEDEHGVYPPLGESGPVALTSGAANAEYLAACSPERIIALLDATARSSEEAREAERLRAENARLRAAVEMAVDHAERFGHHAINPAALRASLRATPPETTTQETTQ